MTRIPSSEQPSNSRVSLAGYLAVAAPGSVDPVFSRSVCIIVEHSTERTVGIMLNRPLALDSKSLLDQLLDGQEKPTHTLSHLNFGGPQNGPVLAIHDDENLAEGGNNQGVYLSAQTETLKKLALLTPQHCRLFIGHAVWGPSQLETEIVNGDWHILPAIPELVFSDEKTMWGQSIQVVGNSIIQAAPGVFGLMHDPYLN